MAYYNFYKIIKDVFITLFGKKNLRRFIILLFIIIIAVSLKTKVFAVDIPVKDNSNKTHIISCNGNDVSIDNCSLNSEISSLKHIIVGFFPAMDRFYIFASNDTIGVKYVSGSYKYYGPVEQKNPMYYKDFPTSQLASISSSSISSYKSVAPTNYMSHAIFSPSNNILKYTNYDILDIDGSVIFEGVKTFKNPEISNSLEDLQTLNFDVISVDAWDMSNEDLYVLFYNRSLYNSDDITTIYPVKEVLLNGKQKYYQFGLTVNPDKNKIYWIPNDDTGLFFKVGNTYEIRLAKRVPIDNPFSDWAYDYLGEKVVFTISEDVSQQKIDNLNQASRDKTDKDRFDKQMEALNSQTKQDKEFYDTITSDNYDENTISDSIGGMSSSTDDISLESYTGLFSAIFNKFSTIIDGDYNSIDYISYPVMKTNQEIKIPSDLLSSKIKNTFIYTLLQTFWLFAFGIYIFKFSNNLVKKIKDGSILNGYENSNEVITSTML